MKNTLSFLLGILFSVFVTYPTSAALTIEDLCSGKYTPKRVNGIHPMNNGDTYSRLSDDHKQILSYSFTNGILKDVLFDVATARNVSLETIDGYIISPDEKKILIQTETKPIYRHSFTAVWYIYDIHNQTLSPLSDNGPQQSPKFSPDGNLIAFVRENNIYLVKLLFGNSESQVTKDGKVNKIINGIPDWVNEEEFSSSCSFDFNADASMIAWIRYDETDVKTFSFPWYKGTFPEKNDYADYPGQYEYKYPIAGSQNASVSVQTFDIKSRVIRTLNLPIQPDSYIPRIHFTSDSNRLAVFTLNRHQDCLEVYMANPRSTECKKVLRDNVDKYINENVFRNLVFSNDCFVLMSERNGYNSLYVYNLNGVLLRSIVGENLIVRDLYGLDESGNIYYCANHVDDPIHTAVYRTDNRGRTTCLSDRLGDNSAIFSTKMNYYINVWSNIQTPPITTLHNSRGKLIATLEDNNELISQLSTIDLGSREFFQFTTSEGVTLNGYMVRPANFSPQSKYPVVMFQYSGPGAQQVVDSWNCGNMGGTLYEQFLASKGFVCVCVDGRGTGGRGAEFEKCTYLNLYALESRDQVETAIYLSKLPYVDSSRIGIWGWSYGGSMTLMSMSEGRPVFAAGVAVAPVTSWRFYDTIYTERYMRTPQENSSGYDFGPINSVDKLSGKLLICHGTADDNVHFRNTIEYTEELIQAGKSFMVLPYNNRNHNISGGNTRQHLFSSITDFFIQNL